MSHRSRVCAVIIDVTHDHYEASARFWSAALNRPADFDPGKRYTALRGELDFLVQQTDPTHKGMHVDIETDDVEQEVARLERLGAKRRQKVKNWWVMDAPDRQAFCVVPAYSETWPCGAVEWAGEE